MLPITWPSAIFQLRRRAKKEKVKGREAWLTVTEPCSPRMLGAPEASSYVKRSASSTGNSWAACLGRPVREGFTLVITRLNDGPALRRPAKRSRVRVARLRRLKMLFDTYSGHLLHRSHSQGPTS